MEYASQGLQPRNQPESNGGIVKIKSLAATALASTLLFSVSACGGDTEGSTDMNKEVNLWMYPVIADEAKNQSFWDEQKKNFENANPGMTLNVELRAWANRDEQLATAIAAGEGPDLVYLIPDQIPSYVETGGIVPVTDIVDELGDAVLPNAVNAVTVNEDKFGVPVLATVSPIAWNKTLFDEAGVDKLPETWEEVKAAAPALAAKGHPIMAFYGTFIQAYYYPLLYQAGGSLYSEDGTQVAFNSPEGVEALEFLVDLAKAGGLPEDAAVADASAENDYFSSGTVAMTSNLDPARVEETKKLLGDGLVIGKGLKHKEVVAGGTVGAISRTSTRKDNDEAAKAALKFLGSAEFSKSFNDVNGMLPARNDVTLSEMTPEIQAQMDALDIMLPGVPHTKTRQITGVLTPHIQAAIKGDKTPKEALDAAAQEAESIMK